MLSLTLDPTCTSALLTVTVQDVNDNSPVFSQQTYEFGLHLSSNYKLNNYSSIPQSVPTAVNDSAQARLPVGEAVQVS